MPKETFDEPGEKILALETEALHQPYREQVDIAIHDWPVRHNELGALSDDELISWSREFADVEREHLDEHPVTIRTIEATAEKLALFASRSSAKRMGEVSILLSNLTKRIQERIEKYAEAVRYHSRTSGELQFRDDASIRLVRANAQRGVAHDSLIDALETQRQAVVVDVPKGLDQTVLPMTDWRRLSANGAMPKMKISTTGANREALGEWALDMDIAMQAGKSRNIVLEIIEKRKKDVQGGV